MIMIKEVMDIQNSDSCYHGLTPSHPEPKSIMDFGQAFSSIMFAFAGASTFPTIQADMKDRSKFPRAAVFAMISEYSLLHLRIIHKSAITQLFQNIYCSPLCRVSAHVSGWMVVPGRSGQVQCCGLSL